ncbi:MAG TPA: ComEC/Rec2 family competence protein [Pseudomonadales bacterium]|nr:ComEC/Rec2 family competence protein [Pseudomonadales bacterium]
MRRPFVTVVSFYAIGLLLAELFKPPAIALFAASFVILILFFVLKKFRPFLLCALLVFSGWTNLIFRTAVISPDDLRHLIGDETKIVTVRGIMDQTPQLKLSRRGELETEHTLTQVRVKEIQSGGDWQPATGEVIVFTPGYLQENFFAGQPVEIKGVIERPAPPLAEGLFDDRAYLETRGIFYELKTQSTNDWKLREPFLSRPPLTTRFLNWSQQKLALGLQEGETLRLLWAMTLGWRTAFTGDVSDPFLRAGTMHLFAIDGLRIALISGMLVTLLRVLQVSRAWSGAIAIPIIWFYTAATGWESSAIRASMMMTVVLGGWALKRPSDLLNSLAAAAFLILLWDPRQLFEASFQLSFFVMLTIALLLPKLNDLTDQWLKYDPLLPAELVPTWRRALTQVMRILARYFSLSLAAWIGSIPLSAFYFNLFSPISPLANLIAVPLGTFALMANLGALICGAWLPWATALFNNAAWFLMAAMSHVSVWFTKIPGSYVYVSAPSWIWIAVYYVILIVALSGWLKTRPRKVFAAGMLALIVAIYFWQWEQSRGKIHLTVLPLNGGHAVFVEGGGRQNDWLVDCGNDNAVNFTLKPFLRAQGVNTLPRLALTEGDTKNCGGAESLEGLFRIGELWASAVHFRSPVYNENLAAFDQSRHKVFDYRGTNGCWRVLWPPATNDLTRADDNALVLLGNFSGTKVLLLSDLSHVGQSALLSGTNDLHADIVIAGLPNEGEPLSDALVDAIQPQLIVIADSEFPATRRAGRKLKERLEQKEIPVLYTRESGAVKITMNENGWKVQAMDGQ